MSHFGFESRLQADVNFWVASSSLRSFSHPIFNYVTYGCYKIKLWQRIHAPNNILHFEQKGDHFHESKLQSDKATRMRFICKLGIGHNATEQCAQCVQKALCMRHRGLTIMLLVCVWELSCAKIVSRLWGTFFNTLVFLSLHEKIYIFSDSWQYLFRSSAHCWCISNL